MKNHSTQKFEPVESTRWVHPIDLIVALLLLVFCGGLYYLTTQFEEVSDLFAQDVTPEFFPRLLIWVIVVLALVLPIEHRFLAQGSEGIDKNRRIAIRPIAFTTMALLILVLLSVPWVGTYLALILVCILLPVLWGERRWRLILPYALIFPTIIMFLFTQVLGVYFEPGLFALDFR